MSDKTSDKKECCKNKQDEAKLVKATDLPIHGNPHPPKDFIIDEKPGLIEQKVASIRSVVQPYIAPLGGAISRTSEIISIGKAHSQATLQNVYDLDPLIKAAIVLGVTGFGWTLGRRRGLMNRFLFTSTAFVGSMFVCYRDQAPENLQVLNHIVTVKLPTLAKQEYEKYVPKKSQGETKE